MAAKSHANFARTGDGRVKKRQKERGREEEEDGGVAQLIMALKCQRIRDEN